MGIAIAMDLRKLIDQPFLDHRFPLPLDRPFSVEQARAEGVTKANLTQLVDLGLLRRPILGAYLAPQAGDSPLLRAQCLALVAPDDCVICDRHAGWLHGAEMILEPNEHLHLRPISIFRPAGRGRLRNGLADSGERNLIRSDVTEVNGLRVTTPLRTAWDLGRVRFRERALSSLDSMLRLELFGKAELVAGVERFRGMRWVTRLRELAPLADGRAASPGESVLRLHWLDCGLGVPELQVEVWIDGVLVAVLDIADELLRFAAEYDGAEWHSSPEQRDHDKERRRLVRDADWVVTPFVAANVFGHHRACDAMLRDGVRDARLLRAGVFPSSRR